jgi:hypothetical protein
MTHDHDRDTVVVSDSGSSLGTVLAVLLVIALLVAVWWFTLGPGATRTDQGGGGVEVNPPTIEIQPGASA